MPFSSLLGFPRIGAKRELKQALEKYWSGAESLQSLEETARRIRSENWVLQKNAGIDFIPSNDFSLYDHVLDTSLMVGAIPERYENLKDHADLSLYFAMARGNSEAPALEMTKWFDTNYHYLVPELSAQTSFCFFSKKPVLEFLEAKALGIVTRPVLLGPVSFLHLAKMKDHSDRWALLPRLLEVYSEILQELGRNGAEWVQMDEPCLVLDLSEEAKEAYRRAYRELVKGAPKLLLATYFGTLGENLSVVASLPVFGVHVDMVRGPQELEAVCRALPAEKILSLGVVDGRNIWKTALKNAESLLKQAIEIRGGENIWVASSCSFLHVPVDLSRESKLSSEIKNWMSFAVQKLEEVSLLAKAVSGKKDVQAFSENAEIFSAREQSARIHIPSVQQRLKQITPSMLSRQSPFKERMNAQQAELSLPLLPTTTIGSFPQTSEVRQARAQFKSGKINEAEYHAFLKAELTRCVAWQEEIGLDVLVHGEFERNDMVEYFGEQLQGFCFTEHGWVQSYGSRCVKPPIIYGDVARPHAMTVAWATFAQEQTKKPMKGMLTGPVTILQWSFVRDDQPRSETCKQIALAIRDEVQDLEKAGIKVIQIDEAALREGLPLRKSDWKAYLAWAVDAFKLTSSGVADSTQIHTHMCYSEFNDIIEAVSLMDADVISIETSRSQMELLDAFVTFKYPNDIGPGVYDIHSPRIPGKEEILALLEKALSVLAPEQIWINPDCGLKTRGWAEVKPALEAMVEAARVLRVRLGTKHQRKLSA